MRRREFIAGLGGAAVWPLVARAQRPALPVVGFISARSPRDAARYGAAFRTGLSENGTIDGQDVMVEYYWLDGQYDRLPALMADLVRRPMAVIATAGSTPALAAKAATADIPIVFSVVENPVNMGLVTSLARPGGNATGVNFLNTETLTKQLELLHELVPKAVRVGLLLNPSNTFSTEAAVRAARAIGVEIQVLNARTSGEIEVAFDTLVRERADALFIGPDGFFASRRVQFAILGVRHGMFTVGSDLEAVEAGVLMGYGTDLVDMYRQVGVYTGRILKGAKPANLPVIQSTKLEFYINLIAAKALGLTIPPNLLAIADEVIE